MAPVFAFAVEMGPCHRNCEVTFEEDLLISPVPLSTILQVHTGHMFPLVPSHENRATLPNTSFLLFVLFTFAHRQCSQAALRLPVCPELVWGPSAWPSASMPSSCFLCWPLGFYMFSFIRMPRARQRDLPDSWPVSCCVKAVNSGNL